MARRAFWLATGVVVGAGSSLWAERRVRRTVAQATARLQPDALAAGIGRSARHAASTAGGRVRDAVTVGRSEMQRREDELWSELDGRTDPAGPRAGDDGGPDDGGPDGRESEGAPEAGTRRSPARGRRRGRKSPVHLGR